MTTPPNSTQPDRPTRSGGSILVDQLLIHGVDTVFCVPGESYLPATDAMYDHSDRLRLYVAKHEAGAAVMAESYGKASGRPGVAFVTRGPGATHASIGVHIASQDSTPMVLFVGQVPRGEQDREAFQELDYRAVFGSMAKWVTQIDDPRRIPELVARAFTIAASGRPGPVVVALPEDMLGEQAVAADAAPYSVQQPSPGRTDIDRAIEVLSSAVRPVVLVGGSGWSEKSSADLRTFVEHWNLPVVSAFRRQSVLDNRSDCYVGSTAPNTAAYVADLVKKADVVLGIGTRLGEMATGGFTFLEIPQPQQSLVHVHPGVHELGYVFQPTVAINSGVAQFAETVRDIEAPQDVPWLGWRDAAREAYLAGLTPPVHTDEGVDLGAVVSFLSQQLPDDAILTNGAGNYTAWVHRFYQFSRTNTQIAPTNGAMGYGLPAAIGAQLARPGTQVISFAGDGCFLMSGHELSTAVELDLPIIAIVINNGRYGTIRLHQEKRYPGRVIGTNLASPNFSELARAYGAFGERVSTTEEFADAFARAKASGGPALLELMTDPRRATPELRLEN